MQGNVLLTNLAYQDIIDHLNVDGITINKPSREAVAKKAWLKTWLYEA